ncbi:N-acetylglucosamine-6-phosphate deacetylase, partial [Brucella intermedia]
PHLAPARKGAHLAELMRPVNDADIALYIHTAKQIGTLLVTLAAEQVTPDQVRRLSDGGVVVSIGHSDTTAEEAFKRFDAGARSVTHLFNAMSQIGHRAPGLAGAALDHPDIWCGIVADGHHVDPMALRLALRAKRGDAHLFFVTDAMALVGSDSESFEINGRAVRRVPGGICSKLVLADGTIAGSDLDMASAVRFGVAELELTLAEALRMASHYPARYLRLDDRGTFRPGMRMDAVHLDDGLFAKATWLSGEKQIAG